MTNTHPSVERLNRWAMYGDEITQTGTIGQRISPPRHKALNLCCLERRTDFGFRQSPLTLMPVRGQRAATDNCISYHRDVEFTNVMTNRSMAPREHGAYGQLFAPIGAALFPVTFRWRAWLLAQQGCARFYAHEPWLILNGQRGRRAARELLRPAQLVWVLLWGPVSDWVFWA